MCLCRVALLPSVALDLVLDLAVVSVVASAVVSVVGCVQSAYFVNAIQLLLQLLSRLRSSLEVRKRGEKGTHMHA
mgnify:CR=1 FL=1